MWRCKEQPTACSGITFLFRGGPVHCMAEGKARLYQTGFNISKVSEKKENQEEREDTKHTNKRLQCMIKKITIERYHTEFRKKKEREGDRG